MLGKKGVLFLVLIIAIFISACGSEVLEENTPDNPVVDSPEQIITDNSGEINTTVAEDEVVNSSTEEVLEEAEDTYIPIEEIEESELIIIPKIPSLTLALELDKNNTIIEDFRLKPGCDQGFHTFIVYYKLKRSPKETVFEVRKDGGEVYNFKSFSTGIKEDYEDFPICTNRCPYYAELKQNLTRGSIYDIRLKIIVDDSTIQYSEFRRINTSVPYGEFINRTCSSVVPTEGCVDTDAGIDYYTNGKVMYRGVTFNDTCVSSGVLAGKLVIEGFCENGAYKTKNKKCKCADGVCVE